MIIRNNIEPLDLYDDDIYSPPMSAQQLLQIEAHFLMEEYKQRLEVLKKYKGKSNVNLLEKVKADCGQFINHEDWKDTFWHDYFVSDYNKLLKDIEEEQEKHLTPLNYPGENKWKHIIKK